MTLVGAVLVGMLVVVALLAAVLAPFDPRLPSGPSLSPPSADHLLGTNDAGQDILSQLVWGARSAVLVALPAAALAVAIGVLVGAGARVLGGWAEVAIMRVVDAFLAVPALPLLILVAALTGPSRGAVIGVIAVASWPPIARVVRSESAILGGRGYLRAARGFGGGPLHLLRRHALPAVGPIAAASFVTYASAAIVLQAGLGFLGLSDPTEVSWGAMLNRALAYDGIYVTSLWTWWVLPAGLAITLAALGLAFLGVGLEPRGNPRLRRTR